MDYLDDLWGDLFGPSNWTWENKKRNDVKVESGITETGRWERKTYSSDDGRVYWCSFVHISDNAERTPESIIHAYSTQLDAAITTENFEEAANLRDKIQLYEGILDEYSTLQEAKEQAIKDMNFEEAQKIKENIIKLRKGINKKDK